MSPRVFSLIAIALCLATSCAHGRAPAVGEPLVATEAGFVLFGFDGVFLSADGRTFAKVDKFSRANEFKAVPVRGGIVAIDRTGLRRFDAQGRFQAEEGETDWLVDVATNGPHVTVVARSGAIRFWDGEKWTRHHVGEGSGAAANLITFAFNRWWVCGSLPDSEDETRAAVWTSLDGRNWELVTLPSYPEGLGGRNWKPSEFYRMSAIPGCLLASTPYGIGVATRDGRTWKWLNAGDLDQSVSTELSASLSRFVRVRSRGNSFLDKSVSLDGEKWQPLPKNPDWETWSEIPSTTTPWVLAQPKSGGDAVIVDAATFRAPSAFLAQLAADRAAAALAARQRTEAEAQARALSEQRAADEKARQARAEAEAKALAQKAEQDRRIAPTLAALAKFEAAVVAASSPEQIGAPAAALIVALDAHGDKPLADAANIVARHIIFHLGGARGYHAFLMELPDARFSEALKYLQQNGSEVQKKVVRRLTDEDQNARFNRPVAAVDTTAWPAGKRGDRGPRKADSLDLTAIYRNLLTGGRGALLDLLEAYHNGDGAPADTLLAILWGDIAQQLVPDVMKGSWEDQQWLTATAAQGSGLAEYWLAHDQQKTATAADLPAIRARYERALQRGVKSAQRQIALLDRPGQPATAGDWFAAASEANSMRARLEAERLRNPTQPKAASASPQRSEVSDEEMGYGPDALARTRAELKALGLSDADIAAFNQRSQENMSKVMADLQAKGMTAEQIAEAARAASDALLNPAVPTYTTKPRLRSPAPGVELLQLAGFDGEIRAVRFFDGHYHAVTSKGVVLRSADGRTWAQLFAANSPVSFDDLCGGDGRILIVPPATVRLSSQSKAVGWASFDHGKTWNSVAVPIDGETGYAAGKFWRFREGETSAYESSTDLKTWQRHAGIPAELTTHAPTLRLGHVQLFAGRVYRYPIYNYSSKEGAKIESSADLKTWQLEFALVKDVADAVLPIQFEVCGDTLVLGTMVALGKGKVKYHLRTSSQPWRIVTGRRVYLGGALHAGGWTLLNDNAPFGGLAEVTRDFQRTRSLGDLSGHSTRFAFGPAGFVLGGDAGRIAILTPHPRWSLRPAFEPLDEARAAWLRGNRDEMQRLIKEARLDDPLAPGAWVLEARSCFERNELPGVLAVVTEGLKHFPKDSTLLGLRAYYRLSTQDTVGAKQDADAALAISAIQPEAALTRFMLTQGQDNAALDVALTLDKTFVNGFVTRAALRNAKGDRAGMLADLQAAETARPEHGDLQLTLAGVYLQLGLPADARRCALKARDLGHPRATEALKLIPPP